MLLTREQVREVDRRAIEQYGMSALVLMENAGRGVADLICEMGIEGQVVVCCGKGNNGGDGFVIARHLDLRGYDVQILLWSDPDQLRGETGDNFRIAALADLPIKTFSDRFDRDFLEKKLAGADWIVDALLGTGAKGEPRPPLDSVIEVLNSTPGKKLAVDLPSGLDADSGVPAPSTFIAEHTCTFVAKKPGLVSEQAAAVVGQVHVLDIGVPRKLIADVAQSTH